MACQATPLSARVSRSFELPIEVISVILVAVLPALCAGEPLQILHCLLQICTSLVLLLDTSLHFVIVTFHLKSDTQVGAQL